jgi:hypothetical protein
MQVITKTRNFKLVPSVLNKHSLHSDIQACNYERLPSIQNTQYQHSNM